MFRLIFRSQPVPVPVAIEELTTTPKAHEGNDHHGPVTAFYGQLGDLTPQPESSHTAHVLTYLKSGTIRLQHGGPVTVSAGQVTLVPAGVPHRILGGGAPGCSLGLRAQPEVVGLRGRRLRRRLRVAGSPGWVLAG